MLKKRTYIIPNNIILSIIIQVELTIKLTKADMRHEETQLHYRRVQAF